MGLRDIIIIGLVIAIDKCLADREVRVFDTLSTLTNKKAMGYYVLVFLRFCV